MKAGIHMLGSVKKAEPAETYEDEIVYKDAALVFQKTKAGLVRHQAVQRSADGTVSILSEKVAIGQKVMMLGNEVKPLQTVIQKKPIKINGKIRRLKERKTLKIK